MAKLELLGSYKKYLENTPKKPVEEDSATKIEYGIKKSWGKYASEVNFVDTKNAAEQMYVFISQVQASHIGFDTEFNYTSPPIPVGKKGQYTHDPRSINPLLLSMTVACPGDGSEGELASFVIDLRSPAVLPSLQKVFRLPVPFSAHFATVELFCLWQLGLTEPENMWDTFVFEKALTLGRFRPSPKKNSTLGEEIREKDEKKDLKAYGLSLVATCQRYGIGHAMSESKEELQQSFIDFEKDGTFTREQVQYAAEDAVAACSLYPLQVQVATQRNLLNHCVSYEMPWTVTNAGMIWHGVKVDRARAAWQKERCQDCLAKVEGKINDRYGISNPRSSKQLNQYFASKGILKYFKNRGKYCFDKDMLELHIEKDPAIPFLAVARRLSDWISDKIFDPSLDGADGRVHPDHRQLGADSGRQACRWPNILGLDKALRPLIIPEEGCAIIEADWNQEEVGVAAAVYQDQRLIEMYNSEDVYSSMAKVFFADRLSEEDRDLSGSEFKRLHKDLRDQMKICTLGIMYGMTGTGLAQHLGTSVIQAENMLESFMQMFSSLREMRKECIALGGVRGYADTVTGLRRYRMYRGGTSSRERNWLSNHPVQGSASTVLKATGNRLTRLLRAYDARIIATIHDSLLIEAPLEHQKKVADLACRTMCATLQEFFPQLLPRAEADLSATQCWNKDGNVDAFEKWLEENRDIIGLEDIELQQLGVN